jgi:hypothetical protein
MAQYRVVFSNVDGLTELDVGATYGLVATNREAAESEALRLPTPEGANFIKLIRDGLYEPPKIGFAL